MFEEFELNEKETQTWTCPLCGAEVDDDTDICPVCGFKRED